MPTLLAPPPKRRVRTLADLLRDLGDIPAGRVLLTPPPGTATEADLLAISDRLCELIDGTLVEKTMGQYQSRIAVVIIMILGEYVEENDLGIVYGADATLRILPGQVRMPDVSFVSWERLPNRELPTEAIPDLVPDLAVEVLSDSNTPNEMKRKLREYFKAGVKQVWFVDGDEETFEIFSGSRKSRVFAGKESINSGKMFPGLELVVEDFFRRVRKGK